jgi:hypothetical protein
MKCPACNSSLDIWSALLANQKELVCKSCDSELTISGAMAFLIAPMIVGFGLPIIFLWLSSSTAAYILSQAVALALLYWLAYRLFLSVEVKGH